jgi:hypothetical protein
MYQTVVKLDKSPNKITIDDQLLTIGSCFAQNIGSKLSDFKFSVITNPFGTLFNPISVFKLVNQTILKESIDSKGIVQSNGIYHHFDLHSDLSNLDKDDLLANANMQMKKLAGELAKTSLVIYTFGTAIVYERVDTGEIVANCHKVPAKAFKRRLLDIDEIIDSFRINYDLIKSINKNVRFILTVSPVRHQKESFEQNNVSKSILRIAIEKIRSELEAVEYFPAFEIMMDELRDYRFYAEDMLHPNSVAIEHIWQKFSYVYFDKETLEFLAKWEMIRKALAHRPFNPQSEAHQKFIKKTIDLLNEFSDKIDISKELQLLKSQLR